MRLLAMLFAGLLAYTSPAYAATVSITCQMFAHGEPDKLVTVPNEVPLHFDDGATIPFSVDSTGGISTPVLQVKFEYNHPPNEKEINAFFKSGPIVYNYIFDRTSGLLRRITRNSDTHGVADVALYLCNLTDSRKF